MQSQFVISSQPGHGVQVYESPSGVRVRTMTVDDCDFAGRLSVIGFRDKFEHVAGAHKIETAVTAAQAEHRLMAALYHHIFIAEYGGRRAGLVQLAFHGERLACLNVVTTENVKRGQCYVDHIAVEEGFRGKGIGQALLVAADQLAMQERCHTMYLWVAGDNRAINLYARQGYVVTESITCCMKCIMGHNSFKKMEKRLSPVNL